MSKQTIKITIDGKTHEFMAGDHQAMKNMAWQDRKQLIDLLENIKQAEYINQSTPVQEPEQPESIKPTLPTQSKSQEKPKVDMDQASRPGQGDVDALMNRLILEDKKHQSNIPDKGVVVKWMLIILAIVLLIAVIF